MTLTSIAVAGLLAVHHAAFAPLLFALAALGSIVAHAANNMINDYFDLEEGLDTDTYPRTLYAPHPVTSGLISRAGLQRAILAANALDALILTVLFVARGWPVVAFAATGLFISVFYVAPPLRLKARGMGEPAVFVIWGPVMVGGTYFAATGEMPLGVLAASVPYALLVTSVLMGKHIDKAPWDAPQGVATLPVVMGETAARRATVALMAAFYVVTALLVVVGALPVWTAVVALALPRFGAVKATYGRPKPDHPPEGYRLWPLWFVSAAFVHARRAGAALVTGLFLGALWPVFI